MMQHSSRYMLVCCSFYMIFVEIFYLVHSLSAFHFEIIGISFVASSALFFILNTGPSLALAISEVLGLGFWLLFQAWFTRAQVTIQFGDILLHLSLSVTILILWMNAQYIRQLVRQNKELREENLLLRKNDAQTGVLAFHEFEYRLENIWTGLKRRNEQGFLMKVSLPLSAIHSQHAILQKISRAALKSIRTNYDIVGISPHNEICIALQNTTREGAEIVQKRLRRMFSETLTPYIVDSIFIQCTRFNLNDPNAETWLKQTLASNQPIQ